MPANTPLCPKRMEIPPFKVRRKWRFTFSPDKNRLAPKSCIFDLITQIGTPKIGTMFGLLWNMTANDTFNTNELGQVHSSPPSHVQWT